MRKPVSWAWVVALLLAGRVVSLEPWLAGLTGEGVALVVAGFVGIGLGWGWFWLNPRPLIDRLLPFSCLFVLWIVIFGLLSWGGVGTSDGTHDTDGGANAIVTLGVLAGLVFAEQRANPDSSWNRQRRTSLSSRERRRRVH